jgi:hypothetical protein
MYNKYSRLTEIHRQHMAIWIINLLRLVQHYHVVVANQRFVLEHHKYIDRAKTSF